LRFDISSAIDKSKVVAAIEKGGKPNIGGTAETRFTAGLLNAGGGDFVVRDLARYRPMLEENKANWEGFGVQKRTMPGRPSRLLVSKIYSRDTHQRRVCHLDVRPERAA